MRKLRIPKKLDYQLSEALLWQDGQFWQGGYHVKDGIVVEVPDSPVRNPNYSLPLVTAGFVDLHTHLREPGYAHKETVASGTLAAARGGFTHVVAMPNTQPVIDSVPHLDVLNSIIAARAAVAVTPAGAMTKGRKGFQPADIAALAAQGVRIFTDDGDGVADARILEEVMLHAKAAGVVVAQHCEQPGLRGVFHQDAASRFGTAEYPPCAETALLERDLELVSQVGCRYHAMHLSTAASVQLIRQAKKAGLPVTAEVTPHHLTLAADDIKEPLVNYKMNPPLRSRFDTDALVAGLRDGIIDMVATDHAPHGREKETASLEDAPYGVTGLETAFAACFTHLVRPGIVTLEQLLRAMVDAPAHLLGLEHRIQVGYSATCTVIDLSDDQEVNEFRSKGTNSPYLGQTLRGWPQMTAYASEIVYSTDSQSERVTQRAKAQ